MTIITTVNTTTIKPSERAFTRLMLEYHRRGGARAAWALIERMSDADTDRAGMVSMARAALAALPTLH